jgi:hypothetical protein
MSKLSSLTSFVFRQDSLVMSAAHDTIAGEQTWPTEAELNATDLNANAGRSRRNITSKVSPFAV